MGLSFDALLLEPQLEDLVELAALAPETKIILNHAGAPVGVGPYDRNERFQRWQRLIGQLAARENVSVKLSGFGMPFAGFDTNRLDGKASSEVLATAWRPYIETCIATFGASRCMFGSNFPVDSAAGSYRNLWNAFKRVVAGASESEKHQLFYQTAVDTYRLAVPTN
jgi:predicted TIM-barrel fold metal-dependent hydrolase